MGFNLVPVPGLYLGIRKRDPKKFVEYCKAFIENNDPGRKAIGIKTTDEWTYIMTMPDMDAKRCIVKGKGKDKTRSWVPLYTVPIERFLNEDDINYLKSKGMDKHGNKSGIQQ